MSVVSLHTDHGVPQAQMKTDHGHRLESQTLATRGHVWIEIAERNGVGLSASLNVPADVILNALRCLLATGGVIPADVEALLAEPRP